VSIGDWIVLGLGLLLFIFSFIGWQGNSFAAYRNGWGSWWFLIQLVLLATLALVILTIFAPQLVRQVPGIAAVAGAAVVVILTIVALIQCFVSNPLGSYLGADDCSGLTGALQAQCQSALDSVKLGPMFGIWAYLILSLAFLYFVTLHAQKSGAKLPMKVPGPAL
jgi:hypothetical protein